MPKSNSLRPNAAGFLAIVVVILLVIGISLGWAGIMPRRLSAREPGFDKLQYHIELGICCLPVIWLSVLFAKPRGLIFAASLAATVAYLGRLFN